MPNPQRRSLPFLLAAALTLVGGALPSSPLVPNAVDEALSVIGSAPAGGAPLAVGRVAGTVPGAAIRTRLDSSSSTRVTKRAFAGSVDRLMNFSVTPVWVSRIVRLNRLSAGSLGSGGRVS